MATFGRKADCRNTTQNKLENEAHPYVRSPPNGSHFALNGAAIINLAKPAACNVSASASYACNTASLRPNNNPTDVVNAPPVYAAISPNVLTMDTQGYEAEIKDITTNLASAQ